MDIRREGRSKERKKRRSHSRSSRSCDRKRKDVLQSKELISSPSSSDSVKKKIKRKRERSSSSSSSCSGEKKRKKKKKEKKKKHKKEKKKRKKTGEPNLKSTNKQKVISAPEVKSIMPVPQKKAMVPMTKEEYEKQQSIVRRVYDPETGRNRLVKGDGEILEEIVSYSRHKEINKIATRTDGEQFAASMGLLK